MFNFPKNMSNTKIKRRLRVCKFCRDVFVDLNKVNYSLSYNSYLPGIIISKIYLTEEVCKSLFDTFGINKYFNFKKYKKTLHIYIDKKYINKIDELETLFKIQGIL